MGKAQSSTLWSTLTAVSVGTALFSMIGTAEVHGGRRACCLANSDCENADNREDCEVNLNGDAQFQGSMCREDGGNIDCPLLCGGSAPECNGECDEGETCISAEFGRAGEGGGSFGGDNCSCVPEIPQGGECAPQPDACESDLPCVDGRCCNNACEGGQERCDLEGSEGICTSTAAQAPAMSNTGLVLIVVLLIALGGLTLIRRRSVG